MRRTFVLLLSAGAVACSSGGHTTQPPPQAPVISLSSQTVSFVATAGAASPAAQPVTITNGGTGTLSGLAMGTITYGTGQPAGWLSASLNATIAPATITLLPSTGSLAAGTYTASVPILAGASGVTNSPQSVSLTLTVLPITTLTATLASAGQSTAFLSTPNVSASLTVQSGSQYLIAVVNTYPSYAVSEGFSLTGSFGPTVAAQRVAIPPAAPASAAARPTYEIGGPPPSLDALATAEQNHGAMLEANRQIFARNGNPSAAWAMARSQAGRAAPLSASFVPVSQTVGTVNKVYVRTSLGGDCTTVDSIGARTVAVGQHVIVLADTNTSTGTFAWPNSLRPDSAWYQTFANEYDQITYPHIVANIGNPIAYDASLSHIGKITVTITAILNHFPGAGNGSSIVAFVNGCDFFPFAASGPNADMSNQTEMFYSWVPGSAGYKVADWEAALRATAAHETKHIVSYTDRIMNNSPSFEEIWLEEGLAQESSEIWERNFNQATWLGNATFAQTVACEISLGANAPCDIANNKPYALLGSHLPFFFQYLQSESSTNGEGLGLDTPANYGAGWTIARWATDQYANGSEATFIKSLINDPTLTGLNNLAAHTGQPIPLLLVYWNLATAIFQTPAYTPADTRTTIPSFNFADIFNTGQTKLTCSGVPCGLFTKSGTPIYPIQPIAVSAAGTFAKTVSAVPGTSASFFLLTAPSAGIESLQLLTPGGAPLSAASALRVAILRVQ
jgi:hypothetical protein